MLRRRRGRARSDSDDVVFVTGASRGIGLEVCRRFGALGASVGMVARDAAALEAASTTVSGTLCTAVADVADRTALSAALTRLEAALGAPTVLINNAGHGHWGAVVETEPDEFRRAIEVNYLGAVNAIGHVLPGMLQHGRGSIVNIASIAGRIGSPFEAAYSASKFALVGYTEALGIELTGTGVTVSLVHPGPVDTDFFQRRGHPYALGRPRPIPADRVAHAVVMAVRRGRRELFVPPWFGLAHLAKTAAPAVYRRGTHRLFAPQLRAMRQRPGR